MDLEMENLRVEVARLRKAYEKLAIAIHKALEGSESQERACPEYEIKQIIRRIERIDVEMDRLRASAEGWEAEARRQGKRVKLLLAEIKRLKARL